VRVESSQPAVQTWLSRLLIACGLVCLGYVGYVVLDARWFAWTQGRRFDAAVAERRGQPLPSPGTAPGAPRSLFGESDRIDTFHPALAAPAAEEGAVLGRIEIPRLDVSALLLEGIEADTLRHGAGHIPGTAEPSAAGNVGIAAHRDSFFRGLKDITKDDVIRLTTLEGTADYQVDWTRIVGPDDVAVLAPSPSSELTLVTCYPFHFVGAAPQRFIVRAHRMATLLASAPG
jgi:sortase A